MKPYFLVLFNIYGGAYILLPDVKGKGKPNKFLKTVQISNTVMADDPWLCLVNAKAIKTTTGSPWPTTICLVSVQSYNSTEKSYLQPVLALTTKSPQSCNQNLSTWNQHLFTNVAAFLGHVITICGFWQAKFNGGKLKSLNNHTIHFTTAVICLTTVEKQVVKLGMAHLATA